MAYLWRNLDKDEWAPTELHSAAAIRGVSVDFVGNISVDAVLGEVLLCPCATPSRDPKWTLLAPAVAKVHINDAPLENGIRVLADRDAIRIADLSAMYFSMERLARIEPFPDEKNVFCPRDKTLISAGDPAVCCPQCGVWHHERAAEGEGCWTYAETCALCDQSTDLDSAGFRWTPEGL